MILNQEIIDLVKARLTGALGNLNTNDQSLLVNAINEVLGMLPYGDTNQLMVPSTDNSNKYRFVEPLVLGAIISTALELTDAKTRYVSKATIFNTWRRFSHGDNTLGLGNPHPSDTLPGTLSETTSWAYNAGNDTINSTFNSSSHIGFISDVKYDTYTHSMTLTGSGGDNDFGTVLLAFAEDYNDMVPNAAYGQSAASYPGINVTDQFIPNQHTLTLLRGRTGQPNFPFAETTRWAIVYDMCKTTQKVLLNGEGKSGLWNTTADYGAGVNCDMRIVRTADRIDAYTTNWSDAPGGKGSLGYGLGFNLTDFAVTQKFRGAKAYGYGALSQVNISFSNIVISPNRNSIYDIRDGSVWESDNVGTYSLNAARSMYTEFGLRRWFYNPVTLKTYYLNADKTWEVIGGGTIGAQNANKVYAGPATGADAIPTFRALTNDDIAAITGLLTALNTTAKNTLVAAINEVQADVAAKYITINQKINSSMSNFNQTII